MTKQYFATIDSETTQNEKVADFACVITDRKGRIHAQCAVLVDGIFTDAENHPLFFDKSAPRDALWSKASADRRYARYSKMVADGSRMVASVAAINRWLERAVGKYDPILTAYNLAFDAGKMSNTGIDHTIFSRRFCLWQTACVKWASTNQYKNFVMQNHAFNPPTKFGNMTYKTNAEVMARFVTGQDLPDEPHTALEDIIDYELPILNALVKRGKMQDIIDSGVGYSWRDYQAKNHFTAKKVA